MIKAEQYLFDDNRPKPECDSCNKIATHKVWTEKDEEYQIGIRLCDNCLEDLKKELLGSEKEVGQPVHLNRIEVKSSSEKPRGKSR